MIDIHHARLSVGILQAGPEGLFVVCDHDTATRHGELLCVAQRREVADRIRDLLDRHGLVDVPDTIADLTLPPPTGAPVAAEPPAAYRSKTGEAL